MESLDTGIGFGYRHVIVSLLFLLLAIANTMRVSISIAIVAMTDNSTSSNPNIPTYQWEDKNVILSSFFWGYIMLQIFAGQIGRRYGTKRILMYSMFVNSSACMAIPIMAAKFGSRGVMAARMAQGLSQGFFFPSVHNLLGQWAPAEERSRMGTTVFAGVLFGVIITMPITGFICSSWQGWPFSFYLFGLLGYLWIISWFLFGANSPAEHKKISDKERRYIEKSLGTEENSRKYRTPWKAIFTSGPVWAIIIAFMGQNWGYSTLLTEMPNYINKVMKFDMNSNGLLSATPYLTCFILSFVFGHVSDYVVNHSYITRQNGRKLFTTIGHTVPALALLILGYLPDDATIVSILMLTIAVGMSAAVLSGFQINHMDISPNFSGVLMGIANGSSALFAICTPLVVHVVVVDEENKSHWRIVFIISALMYIVSNIVYVMFASGNVQLWNNTKEFHHVSDEEFQVVAGYSRGKKNALLGES